MAIGYKTLILIDNSRSVGEANFTLCMETAKYIVSHLNAEDFARIATFGEGIEYITDYTTDTALLKGSLDKLERVDRDTYITDNLAEIIMDWNRQDVAGRNIILFTDGEEKEPVRHANEELYYMLKDAGYPVYVVQSVENKSVPASKNLSAVATISGGELLLTEFEGSEGGSEQIMGDRILNDIEKVRAGAMETEAAGSNASFYAEVTDGIPEEELPATEASAGKTEAISSSALPESDNETTDAAETEILYIENSQEPAASDLGQSSIEFGTVDNAPIIRGGAGRGEAGVSLNVLLPAAGLFAAVAFAVLVAVFIKRSRKKNKKTGRTDEASDNILDLEARIAEAAEDYDCLTYKLDCDDDCCATRILDQEDSGRSIVLEDCSDPTRLYRAVCDDSLIVGRSGNLCDIVIDNDDSVSGRHCELSLRGDSWYIRDLRSSNGTRVNAQKVFQELLLANGDILTIGRSALKVRI